MSIRLDPETEALLARLAARRRQTRSAVIRDSIALLAGAESDSGGTAYDRIRHLVGAFDSGGAALSQDTGKKLRAMLAEKKTHGRRSR